jgi:hypothetical protein
MSGGNLGNGRARTAMYTDSMEQFGGVAGAHPVDWAYPTFRRLPETDTHLPAVQLLVAFPD